MSKLTLLDAPYKGLMPYSEEDAPFFFGRDAEREIITANLMAARLTLLYGPTGVGKSSILRAGVAHHLRELAKKDLAEGRPPEFAIVVFNSWSDDPLVKLKRQIQESIAQVLRVQPLEQLPTASSFAHVLQECTKRLVGQSIEGAGSGLLIILDQFEEYFLYHPLEDGEGTFDAEFPLAVNNPDLRVNFLISIREESLAKLDCFEGRIPNLFDNYLRIEHLDRDASRSAIEGPIDEYNRQLPDGSEPVCIKPELVEAVLDQVRTGKVFLGEPGRGVVAAENTKARIETPFLQLVMTRLWDEEMSKGSRVLRLTTLKMLGGAESIVRTHLDEAMGRLALNGQDLAASMFHYLVTPSGTKIAHSAYDLAKLLTEQEKLKQDQQAEIALLLERLCGEDMRLLRTVAPTAGHPGDTRYEIFHDVLAPAVLAWQAQHVQQQRLAEGREENERQLAHETKEKEKAQRQFKRERDLSDRLRRDRVVMGGFLLLMVALAVVTILIAAFAFRQKAKAQNQQKIARSGELAASALSALEVDPELSVLLAIESVDVARTTQAEDALRISLSESKVRAVMRGLQGKVYNAAFSPDGDLVVTASHDTKARIWDRRTGNEVREFAGHTQLVNSAALSPSGELVVTASDDNTARIWNARTGAEVRTLGGHTEGVNTAAFSYDGRLVVTASADFTVRIWDANTGVTVRTLSGHNGHNGSVLGAQFSHDGKLVVTASTDGTAKVWNAITGKFLRNLVEGNDTINSAAFSFDGKLIVTASNDRTAQVWEVGSWKSIARLSGHVGLVTSAEFSADGSLLVTASVDETARVWARTCDARTWRQLQVLRGHTGAVRSAMFSPNGKLIVTASLDGTARVWEATPRELFAELCGHQEDVNFAAFSPDGKSLVTASVDATARIWDVRTGRKLKTLRHDEDEPVTVTSAVFSPDNRFVVTTSEYNTVRVWDRSTWEFRKLMEQTKSVSSVSSAAFSPDGKLLVTTSEDKTARLWDTSTWKQVHMLSGHTGGINSATFSTNSSLVVTASDDGTARVWEASTGKCLYELGDGGTAMHWAAFSPDGRFIATANEDKLGRIWDLSAHEKPVGYLFGHTAMVYTVEFSRDGKWIVTAGGDGTARVWETKTWRNVAELHGHTKEVLCATFSPDGRFVATSSGDSTARIFSSELWRLGALSTDQLLKLANESVTRELTKEERLRYMN